MKTQPVIFGEVLYDQFPDGSEILGGAPFNVAWHLQGFGLAPLLITAIGDDEKGKNVLKSMKEWGMTIQGVQVKANVPTGQVQITTQAGQPTFSILDQQAYDFIDADEGLLNQVDNAAILYHGSLALRHAKNRNSLTRIMQILNVPVFLDVNLRTPWWNIESVVEHAQRANYVKLNELELIALNQQSAISEEDYIPEAQRFREKYALDLLILTKGENGANFINRIQNFEGLPVPVQTLEDTVGAGDAFSAVTILGLLSQWDLQSTLSRALEFASIICAQRGATAANKALYESCVTAWQV